MANYTVTVDLPLHCLPDGFAVEHKFPGECVEEGILYDAELEIEFDPGWYVPAKLSGHPDSWAPAEGEDHEILAVYLTEFDSDDISHLLDEGTERKIIDLIPDEGPDDY